MRNEQDGTGIDAAVREVFEEIAWLEIARKIRRMIAAPVMDDGLPAGLFPEDREDRP